MNTLQKIVLIITVLVCIILPLTVSAYAQHTLVSSSLLNAPMPGDEMYKDTPLDKMGTGVINIATSWTDIPKEITAVSEKYNLLAGYTLGFGKGLISSIIRGVSGTIDTVTCGLPPYNEPTMKAEYKVDRPNEEGLKINLLRW